MTAEVSSKIDPLTVTARWGMKVHVIPPEETEAPTSEEEERPPVPFEYEALGRDLYVPIYVHVEIHNNPQLT